MIIDAKDLIAGRMGAFVAKQLLLGETVDIVNAEKAVISGRKNVVFAKYEHKVERGTPRKGPFWPRMPHMMLKRIIRGMLPFKQAKGRVAYKRLKCYIGTPKQFEGQKQEELKQYHKSTLSQARYVTIGQISEFMRQ